MKKIIKTILSDRLYAAGLALVIFSGTGFVFTGYSGPQAGPGGFFFCYIISFVYTLILFFTNLSRYGWRLRNGKITHTIFLLVLWFISAFALNREMNVFDRSVPWLCVWIVIAVIAIILAAQYELLPKLPGFLIFFMLGAALPMFIYYAVYLLPLYGMSVIALIALGISFHTYVPLGLAAVTVVLIVKAYRINKKLLYAAIAGLAMPLTAVIWFVINWSITNHKIDLLINRNALTEAKLPAWISVSQGIDPSPVAERILKAGLVYHEATDGNFFWGGMPVRSFNEPKQHDPLVVIATLFCKKPDLDEKDRIKILRSMYNARHQAQERLWSGDDLQTVSVISNVKLFPEYRMAYTEKMLTISNNSKWQWGSEEAVYTFHLSEGSVISSLSLWINGREEKSRLTTKAKADSAYHQIAGVENHDPSVVHWQEGNTVSVRVFPCTTAENRRFKIGITSPLSKQGDKLVYENVFFDGPDASNALETMQVTCEGKTGGLKLPDEFKLVSPGIYQADRVYKPDLRIECKAPALSGIAFKFDDTAYQVQDYHLKYSPFRPDKVYLDLNSSWSQADFQQVWLAVNKMPVYVYNDKLIKLDSDNIQEVYDSMSKQNFSLFPFNVIQYPENALVISKNSGTSPNLNDLEGSDFARELTGYLKTPRHIRFFNIGNELSPYLKALKELRVLNYVSGGTADLQRLLHQQLFVQDQENDETVVIGSAGLTIKKVTGLPAQTAPDHLLRLFAYNDIMKKTGPVFFNDSTMQPGIISEAEKAYIVSPVSSLIVLETQKDYERFGIEENKNSLKNASMKSSGAVPEPKEWMLLLLCAGLIAYTLLNQKEPVQNL